MADNKKYFLDLGGLQSLWEKMKSTFASITDLQSVTAQVGTINTNLALLQGNIDNVEAITLSYAPKFAVNHSDALVKASKEGTAAGSIIIVGQDEVKDGITYPEGFYIVHTDKSIHYLGTSTGASTPEDLTKLLSRIEEIESQIIKSVNIVDGNGNSLGSFTITNNDLLVIYDDEVVADSTSVNALTHRAIAAKFGEFESRLSTIPKFKIEVVDNLPTSSISFSTIYLVKSDSSDTENMYIEYLYIQDSVKGNHWEKLGSQTLALDNYVTKEFLTQTINTALSGYAKKTDIDDAVAAAKTEIYNNISENYATKDDVLTEQDIIIGIISGNIGDSIKITTEQIEQLM